MMIRLATKRARKRLRRAALIVVVRVRRTLRVGVRRRLLVVWLRDRWIQVLQLAGLSLAAAAVCLAWPRPAVFAGAAAVWCLIVGFVAEVIRAQQAARARSAP